MLPGVGIFGTGNLVQIIVPFLKTKGFKIEAIWGRTIVKAESVAKLLDIPYYTNKIDDVLLKKDVDLIFVICSPHLQAQISVKALGIGKHVVCDKPAGLSQIESLKMVNASQYYPSLIAIINHSLRFFPAFCHMKRAIFDGFLRENRIGSDSFDITVCDVRVQMGSLYFDKKYNWLCEESMGGGVVTLVGSHVIDLISFLTNQKASRVHGIIQTFNNERENGIRRITSPDYTTFQMYMTDKTIVNVTLNTNMPLNYYQEVLICGKGGYLVVRGNDLYGYKKNFKQEKVLYTDSEDNDDTNTLIDNSIIPMPYMKGLLKMISSLKEALLPVEDKSGWIKEPVASASNFEDGLYVQAVIDALKRSNKNRCWEYVNIMTDEILQQKSNDTKKSRNLSNFGISI